MNNKGFTLIELIVIIAILALLALISTPNVIKMIEKNKVDNYNGVIDSIVKGVEIYVSDNKYNLIFKNSSGSNDSCKPGENKIVIADGSVDDKKIYGYIKSSGGSERKIQLKDLIDSKDISSSVKNPCTNNVISDNTNIEIILNCNTKQFSYSINLTDKDTASIKDGTVLLSKYTDDGDDENDITDKLGKIIEGKKCSDLY